MNVLRNGYFRVTCLIKLTKFVLLTAKKLWSRIKSSLSHFSMLRYLINEKIEMQKEALTFQPGTFLGKWSSLWMFGAQWVLVQTCNLPKISRDLVFCIPLDSRKQGGPSSNFKVYQKPAAPVLIQFNTNNQTISVQWTLFFDWFFQHCVHQRRGEKSK